MAWIGFGSGSTGGRWSGILYGKDTLFGGHNLDAVQLNRTKIFDLNFCFLQ